VVASCPHRTCLCHTPPLQFESSYESSSSAPDAGDTATGRALPGWIGRTIAGADRRTEMPVCALALARRSFRPAARARPPPQLRANPDCFLVPAGESLPHSGTADTSVTPTLTTTTGGCATAGKGQECHCFRLFGTDSLSVVRCNFVSILGRKSLRLSTHGDWIRNVVRAVRTREIFREH
jgi:hypothetical protein